MSGSKPSGQDWAVLFSLAATGAYECPWGWEDDFGRQFPGWERAESEAAVQRCYAYLRETGVLPDEKPEPA